MLALAGTGGLATRGPGGPGAPMNLQESEVHAWTTLGKSLVTCHIVPYRVLVVLASEILAPQSACAPWQAWHQRSWRWRPKMPAQISCTRSYDCDGDEKKERKRYALGRGLR